MFKSPGGGKTPPPPNRAPGIWGFGTLWTGLEAAPRASQGVLPGLPSTLRAVRGVIGDFPETPKAAQECSKNDR
eukprot:9480633-Pyramimonas_sp.AAC.1